jgi:hypothetical protein
VNLYNEVIRYADNDTAVLPILYNAVDQISKEVLDANIMVFLTAGSMAWYGFVSNMSEECINQQRRKNRNAKTSTIDTKLYRLEKTQEEFCRASIKGGRVCPR